MEWIRFSIGAILFLSGLLLSYRCELRRYHFLAYLLTILGLTGLFWNSLWAGAAPHWLWLL